MPPSPFAHSSPAATEGLAHHRPAPAKINLGLHVLARRPDGYHDIETVMLPLAWSDRLSAAPAETLTLTCSDPALPTDGGNLVVRAVRALAAHAGVEARGRFHLDKRVPYGAGLGSGSSDAAAALLLAARLWALDVPRADLLALAASLGSDVPFCIDGVAALASGRGERLAPLAGLDGAPYRLPFALAVVVPPVHVATATAYRLVRPRAERRPDLAALVASNDPDRWNRDLVNDFQAPIEAAFPAVGAARKALRRGGARCASLSGSGGAVWGVFDTLAEAEAAAAEARATGAQTWTEPASGG